MNLDRPGATLSYDVAGSGPLLLLIPGGAMDSQPFAGLQAALSDRFGVVRYDARGIGASRFTGEPHPITVAGQADDALALIDALSPDEPAFVLGSSGGALTGLELVTRFPSRVRRLIAHEPPLNGLLPDSSEEEDDELRRIHREQGPAAATVAFLAVTGLDGGTPADPAQLPPDLVSNFDVFYRWMFDPIGSYRADVSTLRSRPVVVAVGETSDQGAERTARELARLLGQEPVVFVGEHIGFAEDPERFAAQLEPLLVCDPAFPRRRRVRGRSAGTGRNGRDLTAEIARAVIGTPWWQPSLRCRPGRSRLLPGANRIPAGAERPP